MLSNNLLVRSYFAVFVVPTVIITIVIAIIVVPFALKSVIGINFVFVVKILDRLRKQFF